MAKEEPFNLLFMIATLVTVVAIGVSPFFGQHMPFADQWPIYDGLRQTAEVVFALTGAWSAIAYPNLMKRLLNRKGNLNPNEKATARALFISMFTSAGILLVVLLVAVAAPIVRHDPIMRSHRDWVQGISFTAAVVLTFLEIFAVINMFKLLSMAKDDVDNADHTSETDDFLEAPSPDDLFSMRDRRRH